MQNNNLLTNNIIDVETDLAENPAPRLPICLCLDVSGSMDCYNNVDDPMKKIDALNNGIKLFYETLNDDDQARYSADVSIVTFANNAAIADDFSAAYLKQPITLKCGGQTYMGAGIEMALKLLEDRKSKYKQQNLDYYQPWLVIMTDGKTFDESLVKSLSIKIKNMEAVKKLTTFVVGIGSDADMDLLNSLSTRSARKLDGIKFKELFEWLGKSVKIVSNSNPNSIINLTTTSGWDTI